MTEKETLISELVDKILRAEPDKIEGDNQYIEKARIARIIRGLEEYTD